MGEGGCIFLGVPVALVVNVILVSGLLSPQLIVLARLCGCDFYSLRVPAAF